MNRLAIVTTHPIQYYAPVFKAIAERNPETKVFYTWGKDSIEKYDPDFQKAIQWDIPLLEGYNYEFLINTSSTPGTSHFKGIVNPDAIDIINRFNPDAVLVYGWAWHSHLKIIRHFAGKKKVWFRGDSTLLDSTKRYKKILRSLFLKWVYRHVDTAFYVGTQNRSYFQHFGLKPHQLKFAPHSVDNTRFSADKKEQALQVREKFSIPPTGILILFAGKLEPKKDPFTLLYAFESIHNDNLYLLFAGNGILEIQLKKRANKSPKSSKIFFLGFQNQSLMPALYQACDLFCLPSVGPGETWGLAINEAMAAGRTVIASNRVGCATDLVREKQNGTVFRAASISDLATKIQLLTDEKSGLNEFGINSKKIIEDWSFDKQVVSILEEFNSISCPKN